MKKLMIIFLSMFVTSSIQALPIVVTPTDVATTLVNAIIGSGITVVGAPTYIGTSTQSGTFTDGGDAATGVGFESGIVLTSGVATSIIGPNTNGPESFGVGVVDDDVSTSLGTAGDADLSALAGGSTNDAAVLEFSFQFGDGSGGGDLFFNFVFASEEYIDYINSIFNDVFGFFVDGVNVALVPGTSDPITINTVNSSTNAGFYRNNVDNNNGIPNLGLDLAFDGLTTVITAQALGLGAGVHTMKFAVADTADGILDAGVFLQAGSFSNEPPPKPVPEPGIIGLLGLGLIGISLTRRRRT